MKAQSLKNAILQLAIQGKLVAQNPQDEPASELLKKIKAEKTKLIKEKKIKAEKPLAEITDEEKPFDIPDSWEWVRLGTICTLNPRNVLDDSTPVSFIPMSLIDDGYRSSFTFEKKLWSDIKSGFTHFSEGDIGVAKIIPCFDNRKSAIFINLENGYGAGTTELHIVRVVKETLCRKYILWFFKTHYFINSGIKTYSGTAGQQRISKDFMLNILLPIPPLAEQQRIVEKIEQLMPLVEQYDSCEKELSALEAKFPDNLKKSVLQFAVQGKLVLQNKQDEPASELLKKIKAEKAKLIKEKKIKAERPLAPITDEDKPFDIPDSWEWVRLGQLGFAQTGNTPSTNDRENYGDEYPFVSPGDMTNSEIIYINRLSSKGYSKARIIGKNSVIMVCIGGSIGKCNLIDREIACNQQINTITPFAMSSKYLLYALRTNYFFNSMKNIYGGTATPIVNKSIWCSIEIPLPPLAEQQRIVQKVEQLLALCDVLADENKLRKRQPPKRLAKIIEFTPVEIEEEHEHLIAARADEINPETRAKELEHIAELRRKR